MAVNAGRLVGGFRVRAASTSRQPFDIQIGDKSVDAVDLLLLLLLLRPDGGAAARKYSAAPWAVAVRSFLFLVFFLIFCSPCCRFRWSLAFSLVYL